MAGVYQAALEYGAREWRVLPVHWMQPDGGCSCRAGLDCHSPAKHPLIRDWEQKSSDHPEFLEEWWQRRYPNANIGLAVGVSKLVVVDVDGAEGLQSLKTLQLEYEPLPKTLTHRTGGGGFHFLFRDERRSVAPTRGQLREGLDIRGDGGMIVAPPSRHQSGRSYEVLPGPKEPTELPDWLRQLIWRTPRFKPRPGVTPAPKPRYIQMGSPEANALVRKLLKK